MMDCEIQTVSYYFKVPFTKSTGLVLSYEKLPYVNFESGFSLNFCDSFDLEASIGFLWWQFSIDICDCSGFQSKLD